MGSVLFMVGCSMLEGIPGYGFLEDPGTTQPADEGDREETVEGGSDGVTVMVEWTATTLTITPTDVTPDFWIGLAQTDCGSDECWTGEDCVFGFGGEFYYCHPATDVLSMQTAGDVFDLTEGKETGFWWEYAETVTYYMESSSGECWMWGQDPGYYGELGCTEIAEDQIRITIDGEEVGVEEPGGETEEPSTANNFTRYQGHEQLEYGIGPVPGERDCVAHLSVVGEPVPLMNAECVNCLFSFDLARTVRPESLNPEKCGAVDDTVRYAYSPNFPGYGSALLMGTGDSYYFWAYAELQNRDFSYHYGYRDYPYAESYYTYYRSGTAWVE